MRRVELALLSIILAAGLLSYLLARGCKRTRPELPQPPSKSSNDSAKQVRQPETSVPSSAPSKVPLTSVGDHAACAKLLANALASYRGASFFGAEDLNLVRQGCFPEFTSFAQAFCAQAGDDLVPITRWLLKACSSDSTNILLIAVLGSSRRPDALPLLKELRESAPPILAMAALYSMGWLGTEDGRRAVLEFWDTRPKPSRPNLEDRIAMRALGLCARAGVERLRDVARHITPSPDQLTFRGSSLQWADPELSFDLLDEIARLDPDPRLRSMAVAAIGNSSNPDHLRQLASIAANTNDPEVIQSALMALVHARMMAPDAWKRSKDERHRMIKNVLNQMQPQAAIDVGGVWLNASFGSEELASLYTAQVPQESDALHNYVQTLLTAFGGDPSWSSRLDQLMDRAGLTERQRVQMLAKAALASPRDSERLEPQFRQRILDYIGSEAPWDGVVATALAAVSRNADNAELSRALAARYSRIPDPLERLRILETVRQIPLEPPMVFPGRVTVPTDFLADVIKNSREVLPRIHAGEAYLQSPTVEVSPDPPLMRSLEAIVSRPGIASLDQGMLAANENSPFVLARLLGAYYTRFGTAADLEWLKELAAGTPVHAPVPPRSAERFQAILRSQCRMAIDAIQCRAMP